MLFGGFMSHTQYLAARQRLQRSELAVPGTNPGMFEKAANSAADYVFLDLEDAVAPGDKEQARKNVIEALNDIDWRGKGKTISVRINSLDTHYMYRDVVDVVEQAGDRLDTILIPKVGVAADVYMVDAMLTQIETARGYSNKIGIEALIEITLGMANVDAIATSSPRMEAMHFGVADYAASCRARTTNIGGLNPDYPIRITRVTNGIMACRVCWWPVVPMVCARSMARSVISTTLTDISMPRAGVLRWATRASGRFIPRR
jgi:citrate lyase subunit beta/citryl-CoA lyase